MTDETEFRKELETAINRCCRENGSNTPDFILAQYLSDCLNAFDLASRARERWYGKALRIGGVTDMPERAEASSPKEGR